MSRKRYLIIGDGAAGTTAAQRLRELDANAFVTILSDDPQPAYFRAALTNYLLGELREEQIFAVPPQFYGDYAIHRLLARVAAVDPARRAVWLSQGGAPIEYDALLIASGSRANAPTFEGAHLPGVMTMRTLQDVRAVMDLCRGGLREAVVIGGGPLALEWAHGLVTRGVKVSMMVRERRFLPAALDAVASDLLLARLRQGGVDVRIGETVQAVLPGRDGRAAGVRSSSGATLPAQLVAAAIGVTCNSEFLHNTGIRLSPQRGILVDDRLRSSAPSIFAAGDIAAFDGKLLQLWEPAKMQGRVAARNMVAHASGGTEEVYTPGAHYMATRLYDLDCAAVGESSQVPEGAHEVVDFPQGTGKISYKKLVFRGTKLIGALLFGQREERVRQRGRAFKTLIDQGADVRAIQRELLDPTFDLPGYLRANALTEKPPVSIAAGAAAAAKFKGTQLVSMTADLRAAPARLPAAAATQVSMAAASSRAGTALVSATAPASSASPSGVKAGTMVVPIALAKAPDLTGVVLTAPSGNSHRLRGPSAVIGREPTAAVVLADPQVSSTHAQLSRSGEAVYVRDLGSAGGTWVNGEPVTVPRRLRSGDRLRVGGLEFTVTIDGDAPASLGRPPATGAPSQSQPHLEVRSGSALGLAFVLTPPGLRIGRDPSCAVRLEDPSVSPFHAELREQNGRWHLVDLQSAHGTSRGGGASAQAFQRMAVGEWATLGEGDLIQVGHVMLVFTARPTKLAAWEEAAGAMSQRAASSLPGSAMAGRGGPGR